MKTAQALHTIFKNNNGIRYYSSSSFNNNIRDLLIGCLLGDAHIRRTKDNRSYITFEQTIKHEDYVKDLHKTLSEAGLDLSEIKYYTRKDDRHDSNNTSIYFKINSTNELNSIADLFLSKDNQKIVPLEIENYLSPIALGKWICDDGQLVKNGGITLCTDNYELEEVEHLVSALSNKYGLKCTIHFKKGKNGNIYHRIYISKTSFNSLKPLIVDHIHPTFLYKLHMSRR